MFTRPGAEIGMKDQSRSGKSVGLYFLAMNKPKGRLPLDMMGGARGLPCFIDPAYVTSSPTWGGNKIELEIGGEAFPISFRASFERSLYP